MDWDALPGVYGAFTLSQKMCEVAVEARRAVDQILGHVCHQGDLADSALPVARAWSLLADGSAGRAPLDGLIALAGSAWLGQRHVGFVPRTRRFAGAFLGRDRVGGRGDPAPAPPRARLDALVAGAI